MYTGVVMASYWLRRGIFVVLRAGVVVFFLVILFPMGTSAQSNSNFGIRPAYPQVSNPRTESIFIHTLQPGAEVEDGVEVINNTSEQKNLRLYATDSTPSSDGAFACKQAGQEKLGVGSWIKFIDDKTGNYRIEGGDVTLSLPPGQQITIPFQINPNKDALTGEHNGCVLVQEITPPRGPNASGVSLSVRSGLRVVVTIPGELTRQLQIVRFSAERSEDKGFLYKAAVRNAGNVSIDAQVEVLTRRFFGFVYDRQGGQFPILSTETSQWTFQSPRPFFGGVFRSRLRVTYDEAAAAQVGKNTDGKLTTIKSKTVFMFVSPKPLAWLVYVVGLLMVGYMWLLIATRRKRRRWIKNVWQPYTVQAEDTVPNLSKRYRVSWKIFVKANHLKPPYVLEPGQKIKVPPRNRNRK
jgi:hypothetical protein